VAIQITVWIQGLFCQIRHYWQILKMVNGHSFILICQMAALVRRALAEVCTVPVLLVLTDIITISDFYKFFLSIYYGKTCVI